MDVVEIARLSGQTEDAVARILESVKRSRMVVSEAFSVTERGRPTSIKVTREGLGPLKTRFGVFYHFSFQLTDKWSKYSVLILASLTPDFTPVFDPSRELLIRVDSGCETGQMFGDLTCECKDQLALAMEMIAKEKQGLIINIPRQDGRGLGLPFKLATLRLQLELKLNTVQAAAMLDPNGDRDTRTYAGVIAILRFLCVPESTRLRLMSNNPKKMTVFTENGYLNTELRSIAIAPTEDTHRHLLAKQQDLGHLNLVPPSNKNDE